MPYYLGIDGGGTRTTCVVGDEQIILGRGSSDGSNILRVGEAAARGSLQSAIREACAAAKINPAQITRACIGAAGAARPTVRETLHRIVTEIIPNEVEIVGDMVVALEAACPAKPGIVVISGTGSIAYGRNHKGQTARAGGWGAAISDEGSGHWIGRAAVAQCLRAFDAGKASESMLVDAILKKWKLRDVDALVIAANQTPAANFSELFPMVVFAAENRDQTATSILTQAGSELAGLAGIVMRRIFADREPVQVGMAGGVFQNSAAIRQIFYNALRAAHPYAKFLDTVVEPVQGAIAMARLGRTLGTAP